MKARDFIYVRDYVNYLKIIFKIEREYKLLNKIIKYYFGTKLDKNVYEFKFIFIENILYFYIGDDLININDLQMKYI